MFQRMCGMCPPSIPTHPLAKVIIWNPGCLPPFQEEIEAESTFSLNMSFTSKGQSQDHNVHAERHTTGTVIRPSQILVSSFTVSPVIGSEADVSHVSSDILGNWADEERRRRGPQNVFTSCYSENHEGLARCSDTTPSSRRWVEAVSF